MELETYLLIGAALVGIVVGVLHLVGYVPPRYRKMLKSIQADTAKAIGEAIDARLASLMGENGSEGPDYLAELPARLESLQQAITQVPQSIKEALTPSAAEQEELAKRFLGSASTGIPEAVMGSLGGTVTQDRHRAQELKNAIGQGLLGPYGAILEQVFPPLYDYLVQNPDMVVQALEMPVVQKLIQQGARMVGGLKGGTGDTSNPFLGDLKR